MNLSKQDVLKVARLARLKLADEECEKLATQLSQILDYITVLNEVKTEDVEPMAHTEDLFNILRPDDPQPSLDRGDALRNAPQSDGTYFLVPQILDGG